MSAQLTWRALDEASESRTARNRSVFRLQCSFGLPIPPGSGVACPAKSGPVGMRETGMLKGLESLHSRKSFNSNSVPQLHGQDLV